MIDQVEFIIGNKTVQLVKSCEQCHTPFEINLTTDGDIEKSYACTKENRKLCGFNGNINYCINCDT